ncbi:hypothetical protein B484DRAFT_348119 [Ochromonadaceae sp. CCMP2298]|nr:hypothetical protein B484DRAFT_348119 [Ochromonadaceae sp. CCMP2298]|mmetsp:Transcript_10070/g.22369  ORF Transcript_10070/g.22369 Transcript_10070/m.22369 type:complete len:297 (-) Transcript_10070:176-1066(-)|eukprot:CAMPEP_0173215664 /NCGR_PEP_ID=MMETSP1141-20130122/26617_1 /TAXON_ID=483371 /ORGANISM="non described non described, Strain CCMP2298" /LENGTH=296 /DNA_ID=CAMNT_0014143091 /DNA_START=33 /DNA_END=923 /DNA_ORIENTATION=-
MSLASVTHSEAGLRCETEALPLSDDECNEAGNAYASDTSVEPTKVEEVHISTKPCAKRTSSGTLKAGSVPDARPDPSGVHQVQKSVRLLIKSWVGVIPVQPDYFLQRMLESRKYDSTTIDWAVLATAPSPNQINDYCNDLVWAMRNSELPRIKQLHAEGRCMSACNRFSESIVHMACRRADHDVLDFILTHGGSISIVDDYGRTPLHDACWRAEPRFDIVTMILDINRDLIRYRDARGATPLHYVRPDHWTQWCAYLYHQRERYWPLKMVLPSSTDTPDVADPAPVVLEVTPVAST